MRGLSPAGGQAWRGRQDGNGALEAHDFDGLALCRQSVERLEAVDYIPESKGRLQRKCDHDRFDLP
jgi:hypothetical protein